MFLCIKSLINNKTFYSHDCYNVGWVLGHHTFRQHHYETHTMNITIMDNQDNDPDKNVKRKTKYIRDQMFKLMGM